MAKTGNAATARPPRAPWRPDLGTIRILARKGRTIEESAAEMGVPAARLAGALRRSKRVAGAWERGRLLYNVWRLSTIGANYAEAASGLNMEAADFEKLLEQDPEIADTWRQARIASLQAISAALIQAARGGSVSAVKSAIERLTRDVKRPVILRALSIQQVGGVFRVTRQSVHAWVRKGCPRNVDGSFPLPELIEWRMEDLIARCKTPDSPGDQESRLRGARAELLELRVRRERGEVLDRDSVIVGLVGRLQSIRAVTEGRALELGARLQGMPAARIAETLGAVLDDILRRAATVPDVLLESLPGEMAVDLERFFARLGSYGKDGAGSG